MGILVESLKPGDAIIIDTEGELVETTVKFKERDLQEIGGCFVHCASGNLLKISDLETIQRAVQNLVPTDKKDRCAVAGRTPYEVLVFHTDSEYNRTEGETEFKKRIVAKFRDYREAVSYAQRKAINPIHSHVILRA